MKAEGQYDRRKLRSVSSSIFSKLVAPKRSLEFVPFSVRVWLPHRRLRK